MWMSSEIMRVLVRHPNRVFLAVQPPCAALEVVQLRKLGWGDLENCTRVVSRV